MRTLTSKQKKLLNTVDKDITTVEELPNEVWARLEEINDTEILYQEVNRYLWDRAFNN